MKVDPAKAITEWPLSTAERNALLDGDKKCYMSLVCTRLLGHLTRWNLFGVTPVMYAERIRSAKDPD